MSTNKIKLIVPVVGVVITSGASYLAGSQYSYTEIEVAKIEAASRIEVAKIEAKGQMDIMLAKTELSNSVKVEANKISDNYPANSPLELGELKDWIINFDYSSLSFETLVGITLLSGALTSLICILFLSIYVSVYKLDLPLENYYSGYILKLVNFVKPFSDGFIVFYLTILVCTQSILLILGLRLLSGL